MKIAICFIALLIHSCTTMRDEEPVQDKSATRRALAFSKEDNMFMFDQGWKQITGTSQPDLTKQDRVLVLVHGAQDPSESATASEAMLQVAGLAKVMAQRNIYSKILGFSYGKKLKLKTSTDGLSSNLKQLFTATENIDIIGHSLGGLIAKNAIEKNELNVKTLITLGTPIASITREEEALGLLDVAAMLEGLKLISELKNKDAECFKKPLKAPTTAYYFVQSSYDQAISGNPLSVLSKSYRNLGFLHHDGVIPVYTDIRLKQVIADGTNYKIINLNGVDSQKVDHMEFLDEEKFRSVVFDKYLAPHVYQGSQSR